MLPLIALLLFALCALFGVIVDVGLARLANEQMHAAAETVALEALRSRDVESDEDRRSDAIQYAEVLTGYDVAGGRLQVDPQTSYLGGHLSAEDQSNLPALQANSSNEQYGDLVAGTYSSSEHSPVREGTDYSRNDFLPSAAGESQAANSFLVRLRATNTPSTQDAEHGVSSSAPGLPLLFGRASTLHGASGGSYDPRRDGLTVRSAAIVDARPVVRVGSGQPAIGLVGSMPVSLTQAGWQTLLSTATPAKLSVDASGIIRDSSNVIVGQWIAATGLSVGQVLPQSVPGASQEVHGSGYLAIYGGVSGTPRIVGFVILGVEGMVPGALELTITGQRIAPRNATASLPHNYFDQFDNVADANAVLVANRSLEGSLLAPVLVR